ncbi:MAG: hypothetical protein ISR77_39880 [Pirellulaceae bacterium]|nr:hypothetical protein [Pirellulaceae bacterium]
MSEITLNVLDVERSLHARVHGAAGERVVAALAADPETIEELAVAVGRFLCGSEDGDFFDGWHDGVCHEPWDAGIVFVDLAGRLVASRSSYSSFSHRGTVAWHDGDADGGLMLPYHLSGDWEFSDDPDTFDLQSARRREERLSVAPLDARAVLYDRAPEFIAREVHARQTELGDLSDDARYELAREIHARWLLTQREDLGGLCPRDLMIDDRHEHIERDHQNQQHHWSFVGQAPPGIPRESAAYRFGGFGTHEIVLYYDLVRELIRKCIGRLVDSAVTEADLPGEAEHLQQLRQEWMHGPEYEELQGRSPASVIDRERRRLPECVSGEQAMVDPDCPLCQMMADEQFGPMFWGLDGCNMDDDFAFSFHRTREEWEKEQREYEEMNRRFEEEWKRDQDFINGRAAAQEFLGVDEGQSSVWTSSFSDEQATDAMPAGQAVPLMLFGIGAHLGELGEDLKSTEDGAERARLLRSNFAELRHAIDDRNPWTAESTVASFSERLDELATDRPKLALKCTDLERQLDRLLERCRDLQDFDDQIPF